MLTATDGRTAIDEFSDRDVDVILQDMDLPGIGGLDLLEVLLRRFPDSSVIVLTGHGGVRLAVEAIQVGADNFLEKPPDLDHLSAVVDRARERVRLRRENRRLSQLDGGGTGLAASAALPGFLGEGQNVIATDTTLLLQGETGTGKGRMAKMVHNASHRARQPFVEINCAGLEPTLLASELFGHEKGAFTGADAKKPGLFEVAHGGTLFFDEIGEMELQVQPKLLSVLETRRFRRVGGTKEITADVRIIAATNRDLRRDVAAGKFREDLFFRLSVFPVTLPPLREWATEDFVEVVHGLISQLARGMNRPTPPAIGEEALSLLAGYPWPGNVRELRNVLEHALIVVPRSRVVAPEHFPSELRTAAGRASASGTQRSTEPLLPLSEVERRHTLRVLDALGGNRSEAARVLGIGRRTLYDKLKAWRGG